MSNEELVKALRHCVSDEKGVTKCAGCPYYPDITGCMDRLHTDAAAAIEDMAKHITEMHERVTVLQIARGELEAEVKRLEPKRGEWVEENRRPRSSQFVCSECHRTAYDPQPTRDKAWKKRCRYAYCPNCGAKMEVPDGDEKGT